MILLHAVFLFPRHISQFFCLSGYICYRLFHHSHVAFLLSCLHLILISSVSVSYISVMFLCFFLFCVLSFTFNFFFVYSSPFFQWYPKLYPLLWLCFLFYCQINIYKSNIQEMPYTNMICTLRKDCLGNVNEVAS